MAVHGMSLLTTVNRVNVVFLLKMEMTHVKLYGQDVVLQPHQLQQLLTRDAAMSADAGGLQQKAS